MIQEKELNLLVPSPELLVRLASAPQPLGLRAGPPRIKLLRETYFDTPDFTLRHRGMTCKLRQEEGEDPLVVVTVGEGPDTQGITSRSRLVAAAVGSGVFETLRGGSEPAAMIQKFVDPKRLRPQIALDIQRLGRACRRGLTRRTALLLLFDRISVQAAQSSTVFHELRIRRRRAGGPSVEELGRRLRDTYDLFPDGLSTLQRAYRLLAAEHRAGRPGVSPYALHLALAVFRDGALALVEREDQLRLPGFRGSGEDAARALCADLLGDSEVDLVRLGTTSPRGRDPVLELWATSLDKVGREGAGEGEGAHGSTRLLTGQDSLRWFPWDDLLQQVGSPGLSDPRLVSALLLLTRHRLQGRLPWAEARREEGERLPPKGWTPPAIALPLAGTGGEHGGDSALGKEVLGALARLFRLLSTVEDPDRTLRERLEAVSRLSRGLSAFFLEKVTRVKGLILSPTAPASAADAGGRVSSSERAGDPGLGTFLLDLVTLRARGLFDRLYRALGRELLPALEARGIRLSRWEALTERERRTMLGLFEDQHLPNVHVMGEWQPSFMPEMPPAGCAAGLMVCGRGSSGARFFHAVLKEEAPSFLHHPEARLAIPLEEALRGYFLRRQPADRESDSYTFRFTTGEIVTAQPGLPERSAAAAGPPEAPPSPPEGAAVEVARKSIVLRVLVEDRMPERYEAQLIRALERQVSLHTPLIGWSDLYPLPGPLDLVGLQDLLPGKSSESG